jgi:hypothetical protein
LKKSGQEKRKDENGKEWPEKLAEQQEGDQEKQEKIPEDKRAEWLFGLGFRLCFHTFYPCSVMRTLCNRPADEKILFAGSCPGFRHYSSKQFYHGQ